jgi:Sec-independent protein translocase protein TatA
MSIKVISSASNTISTALGVVDSATNGIGSAMRIFEDAMATAELESKLESFIEQKKQLKDSGLTAEEQAEFKLLYP